MKTIGRSIKIIAFLLALAVIICGFSACGSDKAESSSEADASAAGSSDTASTAEPEASGAVLTVTVNKKTAEAKKSSRPYDASKQNISLILVVGQSNFTTSVGFSSELAAFNSGKTTAFPERPTQPAAGTAYSCYTNAPLTALDNGHDMFYLSDASKETSTLGGVTPAFGAEWSSLTGTKTVFIQAAVGAVGVHEWTPDPESYVCSCSGNGHGVLYRNAVSAYKSVYAALSKDYNIVYAGYIWNQGEHDEVYGKDQNNTVHDDQSYYNAYKSMHDGFMKELALDFGGISVVRADKAGRSDTNSRSLTIARAAQYKLCNDIDDLYMISTVSETCSSDMMDQGNTIHYSQNVFNIMGKDAADNLYNALGLSAAPAELTGVTLMAADGTYMTVFDGTGALKEGPQKVSRGDTMGQLTVKIAEMGNISSYSLSFSINGEQRPEYVDGFGKIDWTGLSKTENIKEITLECVIK